MFAWLFGKGGSILSDRPFCVVWVVLFVVLVLLFVTLFALRFRFGRVRVGCVFGQCLCVCPLPPVALAPLSVNTGASTELFTLLRFRRFIEPENLVHYFTKGNIWLVIRVVVLLLSRRNGRCVS